MRDNYFDLPVLAAAQRFAASEEFLEMLRILGSGSGRSVFDLGAGNGVTSFAMASRGWKVTALEPDPSEEVGHGAIAAWQRETGLPVGIVTDPRPPFPLADGAIDAVIARQVLHHVPDLVACLRELWRILKPGGTILTTRDHVVDDESQLRQFLAGHPLQALYGGENAFSLEEYLTGFRDAGFELVDVWGPLESILNFFPGTESARRRFVSESARRPLDRWLSMLPPVHRRLAREASARDRIPGRIYSFLARKPSDGVPAAPPIERWLAPSLRDESVRKRTR